MKRNSLKVLSTLGMLGLAGVALVSCGKKDDTTPTPTPEPTETPAYDPADLIKNYDKSLSGTVKLTYNANYNVDVNANGGTANMDSFKHQIRSTTTVEMDLGSDLYIKTTKEAKDLLKGDTVTKTEELLYKSGDKYYYETSSTESVEVAASEARAKINEILGNVTFEQAGKIDLDVLLYNKTDKQYEFDYLSFSDSLTLEDNEIDVKYSEGTNGGLKVEAKPYYVGYKTDGGYSDFYNKKDGYAATLNLETNNKGQVTSWKEEYNNASLDFAIMSIPPTVTITGKRSFTASYGEAITKVSSLAQVESTVSYQQVTGGTFQVKTFANGDFANMVEVENGGKLELGKILGIKPTADEKYAVKSVKVNGSDVTLLEPTKAGGWYCFNVAAGENKVEVEFEATDGVVYSQVENGTYTVSSFDLNGQQPTNFENVTSGTVVAAGKWLGIKCTPATGYEVESVKINGTDASYMGGYYCAHVVEGTTLYKVEVTFKAEAGVEQIGTINVTNSSNVEYTLQSFIYGANGPTNYQVITDGKITAGNSIFGAIVIDAGTSVTVTVNGVATTVNIQNNGKTFYCFAVKTAGTYNVVITLNN